MITATAGDSLAGMPTWVTIIVAVLGALGAAKLLQSITNAYLARRQVEQTRSDKAQDRSRVESSKVAETVAKSAETMLDKLTEQVAARLEDYRSQIIQMREEHAAQMAELRRENRELERRVEDLRRTVSDYQNGVQVPRGMVLVPLTDVREMRAANPGALPRPWYVGEDDTSATKTQER